VKEVLIPYFSPLISFVRDSEQILADGNTKQLESMLTITTPNAIHQCVLNRALVWDAFIRIVLSAIFGVLFFS
jgi:hypothetical protein